MKLEIFGLTKIPLVTANDSIKELIMSSLNLQNKTLKHGDIIVIAETLISKLEDDLINLSLLEISEEAFEISKKTNKPVELIQCILNESVEIIYQNTNLIITETHHGFICANAGIDESNVKKGYVSPLPKNPDTIAKKIRISLEKTLNLELAVIISDTQGRAFRNGAIGTAIGSSGIFPMHDYSGTVDLYNNPLKTTETAIIDELAASASLIMGQSNEGIPIVVIRGFKDFDILRNTEDGVEILIREKKSDVFRNL